MRLLVVGRREFSRLMETVPSLALKIMRTLSSRVREVEATISV